jgi:hypothetical protein
MARPKKIIGEIGFEEMLRWAMPKKRIADRFKFYRLYLRDNLHRHGNYVAGKATEDEINQAIAEARKKKFNVDSDATHNFRNWINSAIPEWQRELRRNRAKAMAAGTWSKENREKRKEQRGKNKSETPLTGIAGLLFASSISKRASSKK